MVARISPRSGAFSWGRNASASVARPPASRMSYWRMIARQSLPPGSPRLAGGSMMVANAPETTLSAGF
jgi:hypothetical protein